MTLRAKGEGPSAGVFMDRNQRLALRFLGAVLVIGACEPEDRPSTRAASERASPSIPYTTVEEWRINPDRDGRVIVIDSVYRTDSALRRLGAELHRDHPGDFVLVFTDSVSATRRGQGDLDELPSDQQRQYDRSMVASTTLKGGTWLSSVDGIRQDPDTSLTQITFPP
jgi:hypothetical protein